MAKLPKWSVVPITAGAAVLAGTTPLLAKIWVNTIYPTATLTANGRIADGAALIGCTEGERVEVTLTFTQGEAIGEGRTQGDCTDVLTRYDVKVVARGAADFQPGPAEACAFAVNTARGKVVDTRHWCRDAGVELVEEE